MFPRMWCCGSESVRGVDVDRTLRSFGFFIVMMYSLRRVSWKGINRTLSSKERTCVSIGRGKGIFSDERRVVEI